MEQSRKPRNRSTEICQLIFDSQKAIQWKKTDFSTNGAEAVELTQSKKKKKELHPKLHTLNKKITQLWIMDLHVKWTYM